MLRLPKFQYLSSSSLTEACALLKAREGHVRIVAGGTDILPSLKQRAFTTEYILDLTKVGGIDEIRSDSGKEITIGALCKLSSIAGSAVIREKIPALAEAADLVAATQIRNMGTLGGNIALDTRCWYFNRSHYGDDSLERCIKRGGDVCHAIKGGKKCYAFFAADTAPVLLALNARITIMASEGERQVPLKEIYTGNGKAPHTLKPDEIIVSVTIPLPGPNSGSSYRKLREREAIDFPLAGVAVRLDMAGDICRDAAVVLGAVGSGPMEVQEAAFLLRGSAVTGEVIEQVGKLAQRAAHPVANTTSTPGYRKKLAGVLTRRALREALVRAAS